MDKETFIEMLARFFAENPAQVISVETPFGAIAFQGGNTTVYESHFGEIVITPSMEVS